MANRATIVLLRAEGYSQQETALLAGVQRVVVGKREKRFRERGVDGLMEMVRSGRPLRLPDETKAMIVTGAVRPPAAQTRWSTRSMAKARF